MGCRSGIRRRHQSSMSEWFADGSGGFRPAFPLIAFGIECLLPLDQQPDSLFYPHASAAQRAAGSHRLVVTAGSARLRLTRTTVVWQVSVILPDHRTVRDPRV